MSVDSKRERIVRINKTTILFNFVCFLSEGQNVSIANVANFYRSYKISFYARIFTFENNISSIKSSEALKDYNEIFLEYTKTVLR